MDSRLYLLIPVAGAIFAARRLFRYLRFFQQEEYNDTRFLAWVREKKAFDTRGSMIAAVSGFGGFVLGALSPVLTTVTTIAGCLALVGLGYWEEDPRRSGKLRLNMTERATRIYRAAGGLYLGCLLVWTIASTLLPLHAAFLFSWVGQAVLARAMPFLLIAANRILAPGEQALQQRFLDEAKLRFARVRPFTVGVTGSYGKTSTKAVLGQVLESSLGPTFWPPKGINTIMGNTRDIRDRLQRGYKYAVMEMGAYGIGSIRRSCEAFPPDAAIVTAVDIMHLERFGSAGNVYSAKSELPQSVPADGILVVNGDNAGSRKMAEEFRKATTLIYGLDPSLGHLDCTATGIESADGVTKFVIHWKGAEYRAKAPTIGRAAVSNMLAAFSMAAALGGRPEVIVAALASIDPVENRLVRKKTGGVIFLQDAYNSNPLGFATALEALEMERGERKILMTPGMIELGDQQADENRKIGERAAKAVNLALIVGPTNRAALIEGLKAGGLAAENIKTFEDRTQAFAFLSSEQKDGDVVLIENDLPDLYEIDERF